MSEIILKNIYKSYDGESYAVEDFNLKINNGELLVLVGPSGCGKSTTLRMIAGLEDITKGKLYIDGELMNDVNPKDRDLAMVFQNYALYPHMTVFDNMAYPLKLRKMDKERIQKRVEEAAQLLEIQGLLDRRPAQLSGGQKQRVALGRSIVREPKAFLMDEPLSNLDAVLRVNMRLEIGILQRNLNTTMIYVTHDQTEAMTLGDRIVVMDQGRIQQIGSPEEIYRKPANIFVAKFIGSPRINIIEKAKLTKTMDKEALAQACENFNGCHYIGIRPENLVPTSGQEYKIEVIENLGGERYIYLKSTDQEEIILKITDQGNLKVGDSVGLDVRNPQDVNFFDQDKNLIK